MQIGLVLGGALLAGLAVWGIVLRVMGVRTPPSGKDSGPIDSHIV
jgi:hypothetical protein